MKRARLCACLLLGGLIVAVGLAHGGTWPGVDETVVEKYAIAAGRPPHPPLLDPGEGDLLLFLFLLAGTAAGFVAGYTFRHLFPPRPKAAAAPQ